MGWWRTDDGEAVVGDGPVDVVVGAYRRIAARRTAAGDEPPPPASLLEAAAAAGDLRRSRLTAPEIQLVREALAEAALEYRQSELRRDPTEHEVHATVMFAVGELEQAAEPPP
jgi:hypothetical protein